MACKGMSEIGNSGAPKTKLAKKGEVNSAWHLEQWVEVVHRIDSTEPSRKAHASTFAQHAKRIHERGVADKIQHRVNPFSLRNQLREINLLVSQAHLGFSRSI
jgi:hypothetical protein